MKQILKVVSLCNLVFIVLMFFFLGRNGIYFFQYYSFSDFFFGRQWISLSNIYGILPLLTGTFLVGTVALVLSLFFSFFTIIFMAEYASPKVRTVFKIAIEMMSAIPSVVLGFIGLYVFGDVIQSFFELNTGFTALTGGIMLAFMAIPTIVSVSDDAFQSLDSSYREASIALGASRLETVLYILFPAVFPGIFAAIMLGFGRILGETLAVLMVTGNFPIVTLSILSPVRTLTATIAAEMGEVVQGSEHYYALFSIGLLLFLVSFFINGIASRSIRRSKR